MKSWKKRWFVLDGNCLFYFNSSSDKDPIGIIPLENLTVSVATSANSKRRYTFMLQNPNEGPIKATVRKGSQMVVGSHDTYLFQAASEQELSLWVDSLNRNIFRNPFYLLLANKKKQMEMNSKNRSVPASSSNRGSPTVSRAITPAGASPSPAAATATPASPTAAYNAPATPSTQTSPGPSSRKAKTGSTSTNVASIQRSDSIFVKEPASPRDPSPNNAPPSSSKHPKETTTNVTTSSTQQSKSSSTSTRRVSMTETPRNGDDSEGN